MASDNVCRILLLEDVSSLVVLVVAMLKLVDLQDYEITAVASVAEAREQLRKGSFDLVILDRKVVGSEYGTVLIDEIKAMPNRPAILGYWGASADDTSISETACDWYCEKTQLISRNKLAFGIERAMHNRDLKL